VETAFADLLLTEGFKFEQSQEKYKKQIKHKRARERKRPLELRKRI
jgi:hypothetical protein